MAIYNPSIRAVQSGDLVSPGSVNTSVDSLLQNTDYLREWLRLASIGEALFAHEQPVDVSLLVGNPVYWNAASSKFMPAAADTTIDSLTGEYRLAITSQYWGVVAVKQHADQANILLVGRCELDLTNAVVSGESPEPGTYYLSSTPGRLTRFPQGLSIPVLEYDGASAVFMRASESRVDGHRHFAVELTCLPAGEHTPPIFAGPHVIDNPDSDLPGWLPADHEVFAGRAPAGAVFGYNISADYRLSKLWPPLPVANSYLDWDRGTTSVEGFEGVPTGTYGKAILDNNGIWWLTDSNDSVPWPTNYDSDNPPDGPQAGSDPPPNPMRMIAWFTKLNIGSGVKLVTSLMSNDPRISIRCLGTGLPGTTGDLELLLDMGWSISTDSEQGSLVFKTMEDGHIRRGRVVEGIWSRNENVQLSGDSHGMLTPQGPDVYQGMVEINVQPTELRELSAQLVYLNGVSEESYPAPYLQFNPQFASSLTCRHDVPDDSPVSGILQIRLRLLGRSAGTLPALTMTYRRLSRPADGLQLPASVPMEDTAVAIDTEATLSSADTMVEAISDSIAVSRGDIVLVTISRDPEQDGGYSQVGIVQQLGILSSGA